MFAYSFLAMTSYNILKPITRSRFITSFGAHNLPWVMLAAGLLIGVLMHQYTRAIRRAAAPRRGAGDAGRHRRPAGGLLGAAPDRIGSGLGRAVPLRPDPRHSAHQPVLDARQRRLRRAPGQAAVRLHRRRREPGRRARRRPHDVPGGRGRQHQPAAGQRRDAGVLRRHRRPDPPPPRGRAGSRCSRTSAASAAPRRCGCWRARPTCG